MTKDEAAKIKWWCNQLEQAALMNDSAARDRARNNIIALLDALTGPEAIDAGYVEATEV